MDIKTFLGSMFTIIRFPNNVVSFHAYKYERYKRFGTYKAIPIKWWFGVSRLKFEIIREITAMSMSDARKKHNDAVLAKLKETQKKKDPQ